MLTYDLCNQNIDNTIIDNTTIDNTIINNTIKECYICGEEEANDLTCLCKNMYLHDRCLLESINKLNTIKCTICKKEYKNIIYKKKSVLKFTIVGKNIIYRILILNSLIGFFVLEFFVYVNYFLVIDDEDIKMNVSRSENNLSDMDILISNKDNIFKPIVFVLLITFFYVKSFIFNRINKLYILYNKTQFTDNN